MCYLYVKDVVMYRKCVLCGCRFILGSIDTCYDCELYSCVCGNESSERCVGCGEVICEGCSDKKYCHECLVFKEEKKESK